MNGDVIDCITVLRGCSSALVNIDIPYMYPYNVQKSVNCADSLDEFIEDLQYMVGIKSIWFQLVNVENEQIWPHNNACKKIITCHKEKNLCINLRLEMVFK